jgi:hypothetical protein
MTRLLPPRPALARFRRRLGAIPHGLPTAVTTLSVGALLLGSSLLAGAASPATPARSPLDDGAWEADGPTGDHVTIAFYEEASTPAATARGAAEPAAGSPEGATAVQGNGFIPASGPPADAPTIGATHARGVVGSSHGAGHEDDHDGHHQGPGAWPSPTPAPAHDGPAPTPTPAHDGPAPTPNPDHDRSTPTPAPTPEPEHD